MKSATETIQQVIEELRQLRRQRNEDLPYNPFVEIEVNRMTALLDALEVADKKLAAVKLACGDGRSEDCYAIANSGIIEIARLLAEGRGK